MDQATLTAKLAEELHISKALADRFLKRMAQLAAEELRQNGEAKLPGLGRVRAVHRAERDGRNPATGETITRPAKNIVRFIPFKGLKEAAAGSAKPERSG